MRCLMSAAAMMVAATTAQADEWIVKHSPYDVQETADRLEGVIEKSPASLVARVDHQKSAVDANLEMTPATVLIFGNPALGTPLMQADPKSALDLPARVLIWEDADDGTQVGYLSAETLSERYDLSDATEALDTLSNALNNLTDMAVAEE
jgi:uncharacterized protein (DUF302 family)